jgi:hypothetical protein
MSDLRGLTHGCGIAGKFLALRVANARSIFKMKEVSHYAGLRPY